MNAVEKKEGSGYVIPAQYIIRSQFRAAEFRALYCTDSTAKVTAVLVSVPFEFLARTHQAHVTSSLNLQPIVFTAGTLIQSFTALLSDVTSLREQRGRCGGRCGVTSQGPDNPALSRA
ncbi:hypothetical protein EVAR_56137_1 [Eumeta japonica]|uniref:Uncharacterized protein n=1 Tax=Eumeta variegata TaxID=151549 RepID=A0A4C1ZVB6_EUMVA|nr:hypothetical protein EVAR_56137_1 [Eumeta japonica]